MCMCTNRVVQPDWLSSTGQKGSERMMQNRLRPGPATIHTQKGKEEQSLWWHSCMTDPDAALCAWLVARAPSQQSHAWHRNIGVGVGVG